MSGIGIHEDIINQNFGGAQNSRPDKVLHVAAGNLYGGVESFLTTVARLSGVHSAVRHDFALCFPGRLRDELISQNATLHDLPPPRLSRPWTVARSRKELINVVKQGPYDVAVTHGCWPLAVYGRAIKRSGAKLVQYVHESLDRLSLLDRLAACVTPDAVLANSKFTMTAAKALFPRSPINVCYCPVSDQPIAASERQRLRREQNTDDDCIVILLASRLERLKGHSTLIGALGRLQQSTPWECWIAGGVQRPHEAAYLAELRKQTNNLGLDARIRFLGQRTDVRALMTAADILCQPNSGPESFGIAYVEGLYAGLPVVGSRIGGGEEILADGYGILVSPNDEEGLAAVLRQLIEDENLRESYRAAGIRRAHDLCDPKRFFERFDTVTRALNVAYS